MTSHQSPITSHEVTEFPFDPLAVAPRLLAWYGQHGRDLPWRQTRDPYRIWLSEVMLQQTTVAAVIPYYQRFLKAFPDVQVLAAAPLAAVIEQWAGLGYYSRARNLHRAAQVVVDNFGGRFPATVGELTDLPGVGRSTAGAIVSIAFDRPAPILDGNVRRVLVRLFALDDDPRSPQVERSLWGWAEKLTSKDHPHDYAQAIMDLGATVCIPREPECACCPLADLCQAHRQGMASVLPVQRKRKSVPVRRQVALLVEARGHFLVRQRPAEGFLGGLWELPCVDLCGGEPPLVVARRLAAELGLPGEGRQLGWLQHPYSHFRLELELVGIVSADQGRVAEGGWCWQPPAQLAKTPLHGAHRKAVARFAGSVRSGVADE